MVLLSILNHLALFFLGNKSYCKLFSILIGDISVKINYLDLCFHNTEILG
jgi:hypothetical protein